MADKDREADEAKRRAEEDEEDEALAGKGGKAAARDEAEAESDEGDEGEGDADEREADEHEPRGAAAKEVEDAKEAARVERRGPAGKARASRLAQRRQPPKGSLAKSLMLFVIIVGGLIVAFAVIGRDDGAGAGPVPAPKWSLGQTVDLEITVVPSDAKDLACSSPEEVGGKRCQFEAPGKAVSPAQTDEKKILKPYTTTDRIQFIGGGLWAEPALGPSKIPNTRFSVKCKFNVEAKLKAPGIRWNSDGPWYPQTTDWYAGALTGCNIVPP
jgi:hypothetical protein